MNIENPTPKKIKARRPAELTTFVAALVAIAGAAGLDLSTEAVIAGFFVVGALPGIVTWLVDLYREVGRSLDE